jgi:hypothetical protein
VSFIIALDRRCVPLLPARVEFTRVLLQLRLDRLGDVDRGQHALGGLLGHVRDVLQTVASIGHGFCRTLDMLVEPELTHRVAQRARQLSDTGEDAVGREVTALAHRFGALRVGRQIHISSRLSPSSRESC